MTWVAESTRFEPGLYLRGFTGPWDQRGTRDLREARWFATRADCEAAIRAEDGRYPSRWVRPTWRAVQREHPEAELV